MLGGLGESMRLIRLCVCLWHVMDVCRSTLAISQHGIYITNKMFAFYIGIIVYQQIHQRSNPPNRRKLFTCYESKREKGLPRPRKKKKKRDISTQR